METILYYRRRNQSPSWETDSLTSVRKQYKATSHLMNPCPAVRKRIGYHETLYGIQSVRCYSHGSHETDEEFDARWVTYFNKPDIDAQKLCKGMNTLVGYDLVPEPKIIDAALRACRRLNDFASAVRILEVVKDKAGPHKEIYPYVIQELRPTLNELGISTPEELGLDKV
ncbi:PREDICTED: cytochrome c oxidase subunit 5A, mitochondrial isoform X1 [Myotis brandtii]|uniref:cytochrome c oxidase subunit 5A, mitochondrial isoform X1 n=1 Tax=Myotis brandtii TaxID=109478 RepID=UPI000703FFF7|nr:PREDICTED: cytochrome c oxidase subunit 5A, mitochondrial isoform X1 [Myotis brandtii]